MKSKDAKKLLDQIEITITEIKAFSGTSPQEQSYLAKFLVVYICGIYEEVIETIFNEWADLFKSNILSYFFEEYLNKTFRNPNISNLINLLKKFDKNWVDTIGNLPSDQKGAIDSIVTNKNYMSHGQSCTITLSEIENYYNLSKKVIEKIDDLLL